MTLKLEPTEVKRLNACQDKLGLQWLNVIPCQNLRLNLSNQQLRIAIELLLGSKNCEKHRCVCKRKSKPKMDGMAYLVSKGQRDSLGTHIGMPL